jgi:predicted nucleic acid-binding protein
VYLLDTNIVSNLRKPRPAPNLLAWISSIDPLELRISVATITEIRMGIERTRRTGDPAKAAEITDWLNEFNARHQAEPLSVEAAALWGIMLESPLRDGSFRATQSPRKAPRTNWILDLMIASIAIATDLTIVTDNIRDFQRIHARFALPGLLNPMTAVGRPTQP